MTGTGNHFKRNLQYYKFCGYGFFKNLRLFEPFLILFFLSNGLNYLQIGIIYSVREITRNMLEIPAGIISDSLGRRRTMITSFGFYIISFLIYFFSTTYALFILAMVVYAVGDAFRTGTHKAMIFDYLKQHGWEDQKARYYGHTRSYSQLGSAVSSLIGGFMVFYTGEYRIIFIFTAIPYIIDLVLVASYPKSLDGLTYRFRSGKITHNFKVVLKGFISTFTRLRTLQAAGNLSLHTGFYQSVKDYLQPVLQTLALSIPVMLAFEDKQRTAVIVGMVYFFLYLLTSVASRQSGAFSARFSSLSRPLNLTLLVGLGAGLLSGFFYSQAMTIVSVVFFILVFLNENLRKPIGVANLTEYTNKEFLATILSAESQLHSLITALLAPVIGFLADRWGLGYALLIVSGVLMMVSPLVVSRKQ